MKKLLISAGLLSIMILFSCKNDDNEPIITDVQLNNSELLMNVGKQESLSITTEIYGNTIVWQSSDEDIAIVNDQGVITTVAGGTVVITARVNNVQATCTVIVNPDVFLIQRESDDEIPSYWKNGEKTTMGNEIDKRLNSIFVYEEDVYVTGEDWFSDGKGFLWKNGESQNLPPSSGRINEMKSFIKDDEGNEYMCAEIFTVDNDKIPVYWVNGMENMMETTPPSSILFRNWSIDIYDMYVEDGDVYIVGNQRVSSTENLATLWKNGVIQAFTGDISTYNFNSVFVNDGNVFVVGYERVSNTQTVAKYWKNDDVIDLFSENNSAFAESIVVAANGDVYVAGLQFLGTQRQAVYWKNGDFVILDNGSHDSVAKDIFIFDNDFYITGYSRNEDADFAYWKNGVPVTNSGKALRGGSWSLFVR